MKKDLFQLVEFNEDNFRVYFSYLGEEPILGHARLSWRGLTVHHADFDFHSDKSIVYYISLEDKKIWDFVDSMDLIIETEIGSQTILVKSLKDNQKYDFIFNLKTNKKDTSYYTFEEIFLKRVYDNDLVKVNKGDVVVDIGTNYGFFIQYILEREPSEIHCYEPTPAVFENLIHNYSSYNNITFFNEAISSKNGTIKFKDDIASASNRISDNEEGYDVKSIDINSLIDRLPKRINFLKIDCEGCEKNIFEDILFENLNKIDKIVVEFHNDRIKKIILKKLIEGGFIIDRISNNIIFSYNKSLKIIEKKKKIVLISTFCDTEKKIDVLKDNLKKIKSLDLDVMIIAPNFLPVDKEIVGLCDFVFYTKENPLLNYPVRQYSHWYEKQLLDGRVITLHRGFADYGWAALYQTKKLSQIALTFDYDLFYHLIYDVEIDDTLIEELMNNNSNIIHPRRNPNHPEEIWETTLHFMVFDREMMKKIEREITLEEYLSTNGVAEGEVLKWTKKFDLKISEHCVKDKIFYWENFDFFNVSPFSEFKMFISKNPELQIWLGYDKPYPQQLSPNLKIVFHEIPENFNIEVIIDGERYKLNPIEWEYIEIPINSQEIKEIKFIYKNEEIDFTKKYSEITLNQVFYNFRG